jgi:pimeloyl-ACP methyl ester carboxylesterase
VTPADDAQALPFDPKSLGDLYPFEPRGLALEPGVTLRYLDEGPKDGPVALMVHGNPTWSFYYREVVKALRQDGFRCIVPDHVGSGLSSKPQDYPYTLGRHAANVSRLVEELGLREVTLIVHDWGGAIGMGWATRHPELVKRLVVLNTAAFRSTRIPPSIALCRIPLLGDLLIRGLNGFARAAVVRAVMKPMRPEVARGYLAPYDSWRNRVGNLRFVQDIPMSPRVRSWDVIGEIEAGLPSLASKPMLVCWGGRDFCFDDTFLATWRAKFPDAEVHRFAEAGHYVLEDAGPEVIERVRAFIARTTTPAAAPAVEVAAPAAV